MRTTLCTTNRLEGTLGSKATGEPAMLMGCSVAFALRNAIKAAREEFGLGGDDGIPGWVKLCKIIGLLVSHFLLLISFVYKIII